MELEFVKSAKHIIVWLIGAGMFGVMGWVATNIQNQNVQLAQLVVEVKQLNEKTANYASKESVDAQTKRVDELNNRVTQLERNTPYKDVPKRDRD